MPVSQAHTTHMHASTSYVAFVPSTAQSELLLSLHLRFHRRYSPTNLPLKLLRNPPRHVTRDDIPYTPKQKPTDRSTFHPSNSTTQTPNASPYVQFCIIYVYPLFCRAHSVLDEPSFSHESLGSKKRFFLNQIFVNFLEIFKATYFS